MHLTDHESVSDSERRGRRSEAQSESEMQHSVQGVSCHYLWISSRFDSKGGEIKKKHTQKKLTPVSWKRLVDLVRAAVSVLNL